jgi:hypothetical protein
MNWISKKLGFSRLIDLQEKNNELLKEVIRIQKHGINNDCQVHSRKRSI